MLSLSQSLPFKMSKSDLDNPRLGIQDKHDEGASDKESDTNGVAIESVEVHGPVEDKC